MATYRLAYLPADLDADGAQLFAHGAADPVEGSRTYAGAYSYVVAPLTVQYMLGGIPIPDTDDGLPPPPVEPPPPPLLGLVAIYDGATLRVYFDSSFDLTFAEFLNDPETYSIDGGAVVVEAVTPGAAFVELTLTSQPGVGTHTIEIPPEVLRSIAGGLNESIELTFEGRDTSAPTIVNMTPPPGDPLERMTPIQFDLIDDGNLGLVLVTARFPKGPVEVIHDGSGFMRGYSGTVESIANGRHYIFTRDNGWTRWSGPPTISIYATDRNGNEVV